MIIKCPGCGSSFENDKLDIPPEGREFYCVRCKKKYIGKLCGDNIKTWLITKPTSISNRKLIYLIFAGFVCICLLALSIPFILLNDETEPSNQPSEVSQLRFTEKFKKMTPAEHLANARTSLANKNYITAKIHLNAISKEASEYDKAKALQKEVVQQQLVQQQKKHEVENGITDDDLIKQVEKTINETKAKMKKYYCTSDDLEQLLQAAILLNKIKGSYSTSKDATGKRLYVKASTLLPKLKITSRDVYASTVEEMFMKSGKDIQVKAVGSRKETLKIKYVLLSQPLVYMFHNDYKIGEAAKNLGFLKLVYTNGFQSSLGRTWTIDLK